MTKLTANELIVSFDGNARRNAKVLLNGEEVTNDTFKIEINVENILLYRFAKPRAIENDEVKSYTTEIDQIKVN